LRSAAAIALATLVVAAGCGGGEGLSDTHRERLAARVQQARTAAEGRDAGGALRALTSFRANVRAAARRGELSKQDADRLLAGALQAQRRVRAEITPEPTPAPAPLPTATATAAPAPPAPARGKKPKDKGKGHDKGGKGGD
jgi:hypothetical protein